MLLCNNFHNDRIRSVRNLCMVSIKTIEFFFKVYYRMYVVENAVNVNKNYLSSSS